jgi:hypothetical protein
MLAMPEAHLSLLKQSTMMVFLWRPHLLVPVVLAAKTHHSKTKVLSLEAPVLSGDCPLTGHLPHPHHNSFFVHLTSHLHRLSLATGSNSLLACRTHHLHIQNLDVCTAPNI